MQNRLPFLFQMLHLQLQRYMKTDPEINLTLLSVAFSGGGNSNVCGSFRVRINNTFPLSLQTSTSFSTFLSTD